MNAGCGQRVDGAGIRCAVAGVGLTARCPCRGSTRACGLHALTGGAEAIVDLNLASCAHAQIGGRAVVYFSYRARSDYLRQTGPVGKPYGREASALVRFQGNRARIT